MNTSPTRLLITILALSIATQIHVAAAGPDPTAVAKAEVIAAYDAAVAASEALNADALIAMLAANDEGALITDGRLIMTRAEVASAVQANCQRLQSLKYELDQRQVKFLGPDLALLIATGRATGETHSGQSFSRRFAHTVVYTRENGAWRVLHSHQSSAPAEPAS